MKIFSELNAKENEKALAIHSEAIIIDGSNPSLWTDQYIQKMLNAGVTAAVPALGGRNFSEAVRSMYEWYLKFDSNPNKLLLATSAQNIRQAKKEEKHAIIFGFHSGDIIEDDIHLLSIFHRLGLRILQFAANRATILGDGVVELRNAGLSDLGFEAVKEMNALGILIDLSHCGIATSMETIEASKDPVVFSHSNVRSIVDNPRNKTDEQIKALAEKGGVMGVLFSSSFLSTKLPEKQTLGDLLNHIDYIVNLVGADHIGLGSDFSEGRDLSHMRKIVDREGKKIWPWAGIKPKDIDTVSKLPNITKGLVARGYSDQEIKKILGGNFLRVYERVWK